MSGRRSIRSGPSPGICFALPGLRRYGLTEDQIPNAVAKAQNASSMKGSPIQLAEQELQAILTQALD